MHFNIALWAVFGAMVAIPAILIAAYPQPKPNFVNREGVLPSKKEMSMNYQHYRDLAFQRWNGASKENKIIAVTAAMVLLLLITWQVCNTYVVNSALDQVSQAQSALERLSARK